MFNEINVQIAGNLTAAPELRFTPAGKAVATFQVAQTPRRRNGNGWVDGTTTFLRCEAWEAMGENVAESLGKGDRVVVVGRLRTERFTARNGDRAGQEITTTRLIVDEIGVSLRWATAKPVRPTRNTDATLEEGDAQVDYTEVEPTGGYTTYAAASADNAPDAGE
jgi:single-strand DNA-binding protein